jgi:serine/threonine protein phosphatase PrpC
LSGSSRPRKPRDDEIDIHALTHPGKVRTENQDHFLVCQLEKQMDVWATSLPHGGLVPIDSERLAFLMMVADGVGSRRGGEAASRSALEGVTSYVSECIQAYYTADAADEAVFTERLAQAALRVHGDLVRTAPAAPGEGSPATTLTLFIGLWPRAYLVQVGDSRYYIFDGRELRQISRDQTLGQELVDQGVLASDKASRLKWARALSSSIGGSESRPVVTSFTNRWENVHLLCSDGLTKHVPDQRIRERLATMESARQACEGLLQDALDGGGTDNVTLIIARTVRKHGPRLSGGTPDRAAS